MSVDVMSAVWKHAPYSGNTLLTLLALADWSDDAGLSWPSVEKLSGKTRQSERNTRYTLRKLEADGFVTQEHRKDTSSLYRINLAKLYSGRGVNFAGGGGQILQGGGQNATEPVSQIAPYTSLDTSVKANTNKHSEIQSVLLEGLELEVKKFIIPEWVPADLWKAFIEMRKKIKAPMTDKAVELAIRKLQVLATQGYSPGDVLEQSILNGWKGLFPVKEDYVSGKRTRVDEIQQRNREILVASLNRNSPGS